MDEVRRGEGRVRSRRGTPLFSHAAAHLRRIFNAKHLFDWMTIRGDRLRATLEAGIVPCSCPIQIARPVHKRGSGGIKRHVTPCGWRHGVSAI